MKNVACIFVICALVLSFSTTVFANKDNYATGFVGASIASDSELSSPQLSGIEADVSYDLGFVVGFAVGHDLGHYRFEGEFGYLRNELDELDATISAFGISGSSDLDGDISLFTVLLNGYYDFISSGPMTPYLSAGFGLGSAEFSIGSVSEQDAVTLFQLGAGISYELSETLSFDVRYRYLVTSDLELDDLDVDFSTHNVLLGIRKNF